MASNITVDTLTKGSTTLNTDEIVDTNSSQVCKAWVNFSGSGTPSIRASHNVSSITDVGTGQYWVNFTINMPDTNYSAISGVQGGQSSGMELYAVHRVNFQCRDMSGSSIDRAELMTQVFSN